MNSEAAVLVFESLSSPVRLAIYRLLVKAGPSGLVAGQIASDQGLAANNASFHLKALTQAGLIAAEAEALSALSRQGRCHGRAHCLSHR